MTKKNLIGLSVGSVVVLVGGAVIYFAIPAKPQGPTFDNIHLSRGTIRNTILSSGSVGPENRLDIKPPIAGRIERILVEEGQRVKQGQIIAWMSSTERAALMDAAKAKGPEEVKYWEEAEKSTPLIAPINGVIILKNSEQGQTVTSGDAVLTMSDRLIIKALVDETDIAQVKNGQKVEIVLDAYDQVIMPGKVVHIAYDAKTVNNVTTYAVDTLPDKTPKYMKSGMTANVTFIIDTKDDAAYLPTAAIKRERGRSYVLTPNPKGKGEPVQIDIEVGVSDGKKTEILSGLQETETVLLPKVKAIARRSENKPGSPFSPMGGPGGPGGGGGGRPR